MAAAPDARILVGRILDDAVAAGASDVHLEPTADACQLKQRVDGMLRVVEHFDPATGRSLVGRLMVMANLLTYRPDVPQEGRMEFTSPTAGRVLHMRLAIMPTTRGLRAAVRLPAELLQPRSLTDLQLPDRVLHGLLQYAADRAGDAGMLVVTGPAGSGKTTTLYALLEHIAATQPHLSLIALEDPVERNLPGVTQIEVRPFGELTYAKALRSILRQDPQVLMLGEIRDAQTASLAVQAALSGHRLICTLHAGTCAGAIARLLEMGLEPYQITSALYAVVHQRLLRRSSSQGYHGRVPAAEIAFMDEALRQAVLGRQDSAALAAALSRQAGYVTLRAVVQDLVSRGLTDAPEAERIVAQTSS